MTYRKFEKYESDTQAHKRKIRSNVVLPRDNHCLHFICIFSVYMFTKM